MVPRFRREGIRRNKRDEEERRGKQGRGAVESRPSSIPTPFLAPCSSFVIRLVFVFRAKIIFGLNVFAGKSIEGASAIGPWNSTKYALGA